MTLLAMIAAILALGLLVVIGLGVRRILQDVGFMAGIVERNIADAEDHAAQPQSVDPEEGDDDTRPAGFGVRLRERS